MNLTQEIKRYAGKDERISVNHLLAAAEKIDAQRNEMRELLEKCKKQVGTYLGEEIAYLLSQLDGVRFNAKEFHHERLPEGQE